MNSTTAVKNDSGEPPYKVSGMDGKGFIYRKTRFFRNSDAIVREEIFVEPPIRNFIKEASFNMKLSEIDNRAFLQVLNSFLVNKKLKTIRKS